jgi:hypothetical protein
MHAPRPRPYSISGANPPASIPASQTEALERRQALDEQQRGFREPSGQSAALPHPHLFRMRPRP